jgi:hypothetical protein
MATLETAQRVGDRRQRAFRIRPSLDRLKLVRPRVPQVAETATEIARSERARTGAPSGTYVRLLTVVTD